MRTKTPKDYINLLPPEEKRPLVAVRPWQVVTILFLLVWLVLFGLKFMELRKLQGRLAAATGRARTAEQQLAAVRKELGVESAPGKASGQEALVRTILQKRVLWSEVFRRFSRIVPRGMWFDSLEGSSAGRAEIRIRGGAFSYTTIADFMMAMERTSYFEKPQLLSAQKSVVQGRDVVGFSITCGIRKGQGEK